MTHTKLSCGKTLIELTKYKGLTFWWYRNQGFHEFVERYYSGDFYLKVKPSFFSILFFYKKIELFFDLATILLIKSTLALLGKNLTRKGKIKRKILVTAQDREWKYTRDIESLKLKKSDNFYDSILKILHNEFDLIGIYPLDIYRQTNGFKVYLDKLINWYIPHKSFERYWSFKVWKKERDAGKHFRSVYKTIRNDKVFRELCNYQGRDLFPYIDLQFKLYFLVLFPRAVKYIEIAKELIKKEKPDLVLLQDENGDFGRSLIWASKQKKVPTVAIQHGVITQTDPAYIYEQEDKDTIILADKTCVYGQYHYDLLNKYSVYPSEKLFITGSPKYDIIHHANKFYSRKSFLKRYNISSTNKIILWTTTCHGINDVENLSNFNTVFGAIQNLNDCTLIIKQHPREGARYTNWIKDCVKNYKIDVRVTPKKSDTIEQIYNCDLMITKQSATAMEAIAFNKPVIILNLSGDHDTVEYVREGVAAGVYVEKNLQTTIENLLNDDTELAKNRGKYLEKNLHKIDGKASQRVVDQIKSFL